MQGTPVQEYPLTEHVACAVENPGRRNAHAAVGFQEPRQGDAPAPPGFGDGGTGGVEPVRQILRTGGLCRRMQAVYDKIDIVDKNVYVTRNILFQLIVYS